MTAFTSQSFDLKDLLIILFRRKWLFLLPFLVVFLTAGSIALLLPAIYKSEARFLIQRQSIPSNFVATTVNSYVQEQIEQIRQRLTTYDNLVEIADRFLLDPGLLANDPATLVANMRDSISVEMVDITASNPDERGARLATVAFTVAFEGSTPEITQEITNVLAERFLEEHRLSRAEQAERVSDFLNGEATRLRLEIEALDEQLAAFKQEERNQLPELMSMNLSLFEDTQRQIQALDELILNTNDRIDAIRAELSLTDPYEEIRNERGEIVLSGQKRLSLLTTEYLRASSRYSARHPDVVRLAREIRTLADQTGQSARADELMREFVAIQEELRQARQVYGEKHPEVARLEKSSSGLQRGFESALINGGDEVDAAPPDNPRYVALQTELEAREAALLAQTQRLTELKAELKDYETRIFETPIVERDFKALARDYESAVSKYQELTNKEIEARLAEEIESGDSGEQFVLASGAYLPVLPESPNRIGILLLGFLFGGVFGLAAVSIAEYNDKTIRSARMVFGAIGVAPLAVIPVIEPEPQTRQGL